MSSTVPGIPRPLNKHTAFQTQVSGYPQAVTAHNAALAIALVRAGMARIMELKKNAACVFLGMWAFFK
jgi:hypothetical protein